MRVLVGRSSIHGNGVYLTSQTAEKVQIKGEMVSPEDFPEKTIDVYHETKALLPREPWIYLNHSEDPNCELQLDENHDVWLVPLREIAFGEELTINYGFTPEEED